MIMLDIQNAKFTITFLFFNLFLRIQEAVNIIPKIPVIVYAPPEYIECNVDKIIINNKIYSITIINTFPPLFV